MKNFEKLCAYREKKEKKQKFKGPENNLSKIQRAYPPGPHRPPPLIEEFMPWHFKMKGIYGPLETTGHKWISLTLMKKKDICLQQ